MTFIFVDRNNIKLMESVNNLFRIFNIKNKNSLLYLYCLKNIDKCNNWIKHFYEYTGNEITTNIDNILNNNGILRSNLTNRFKHYRDYLENNTNEINENTIIKI